MQVTEQSTQLVGEALRTDIQRLTFQNVNLEATAFGAAYDAERQYILGLPIGPTENSCSQQYVLNVENGTWTRWTKAGATSALALPIQQRLLMTFAAPLPVGNVVTGLTAKGVYYERKGGVCSMDYTDLIGGLPAATYAALSVQAAAGGAPPTVVARATLTYAQDMHQQVFPGDLLLFKYTDADTKTRSQYRASRLGREGDRLDGQHRRRQSGRNEPHGAGPGLLPRDPVALALLSGRARGADL